MIDREIEGRVNIFSLENNTKEHENDKFILRNILPKIKILRYDGLLRKDLT